MEEIQSKVAQYIVGDIKLSQLMDSHRLSVPFQKRFKFDDTWITMNRKIGEAIVDRLDAPSSPSKDRRWKPTSVQERRRNAIAVTDLENRLASNGLRWPQIDDWLVSADKRIRYAPFVKPLRKVNKREWMLADVSEETSPAVVMADESVVVAAGDDRNAAAKDEREENSRKKVGRKTINFPKVGVDIVSSDPIAPHYYRSYDKSKVVNIARK